MFSWSAAPGAPLAREREHPLHERAGLLDLRRVTGPGDRFDPRAGNRRAVRFEILLAYEPVAQAADQQDRQFEPAEPVAQLGIMHVGLPGVERERLAGARRYPLVVV